MERMLFQSNYVTENTGSELGKIAEGARQLVKEYISKNIKTSNINFASNVNAYFKNIEVDSYEEHNETVLKAMLQYAAKGTGYACESFADFKNRQLTTDPTFVARFNAILAEAINPIVPDIVSETFMGLADVNYVDFGDTATYTVDSNELFYVKEIAEGVSRGAMQRLYKNEFTVNPTPKQIRVELPWYQVVSGVFDLGNWLYRVGASFAGYINAQVVDKMAEAFDYIPAAYKATGSFSDTNFVKIAQAVKAANGGRQVQVWGTLAALGVILPTGVTGLSLDIGNAYTILGYLGMYKGVPMVEIEQVIKNGKINDNTASENIFAIPDDVLYFIPVESHNPIKVVFEGNSVTVEKDGSSSDKNVGVTVTMRIGVAAVIGSIMGQMKISG